MENVDMRSNKEKLAALKWRAKEKFEEAKKWVEENKQLVVVMGPVVAGGIIELIKISTRRHTVNEERALKERFIYDRAGGHYYELRRQPKQSEWLMIEERKMHGESLGMILQDMRLLK